MKKLILVALIASGLFACNQKQEEKQHTLPNILVIVADDMGSYSVK